MKINSLSVLFILLLILFSNTSSGQYVVKKVNDQTVNTSQDGFFYSLPKTVLKINLVYEKIEKIKGPLSDYTLNYLGTPNFIKSNSTDYRILNVEINSEIIPDGDQLYYVQFPAERNKDEKAMIFSLSSQGTLLGFDEQGVDETEQSIQNVDQTFVLLDSDRDFDFQAEYNRKKKYDTITRRITIDTVSIDRFILKPAGLTKTMKIKPTKRPCKLQK